MKGDPPCPYCHAVSGDNHWSSCEAPPARKWTWWMPAEICLVAIGIAILTPLFWLYMRLTGRRL